MKAIIYLLFFLGLAAGGHTLFVVLRSQCGKSTEDRIFFVVAMVMLILYFICAGAVLAALVGHDGGWL